MHARLAATCLALSGLLAGCAAQDAPPASAHGAAGSGQKVHAEVRLAAGSASEDGTDEAADEAADEGLGASCTGPAGLRVSYPAGWAVNRGETVPACTMFSPEPFTVPPYSDVRVAAIVLKVSDLPVDQAAAATPDETVRTEEVVDGRPAVRTELVAGPGLWPEGTPVTRWVVDLGDATLVADTVGLAPFDHERDVEVLDAMMRELDVDTAV
jgi:hypothetical protein